MTREQTITRALEASPTNRGLTGADWLSQPGNFAVVAGNDVALFDGKGDGIFEGHFLFEARGKAAIVAAREAFRVAFEVYGARMIMGLVPADRRDVNLLVRWAGGKHVGIRQTSEGPCELFVLPREMWKGQNQ